MKIYVPRDLPTKQITIRHQGKTMTFTPSESRKLAETINQILEEPNNFGDNK